jgi:formate-dependent nitrite reductase membrane component NrfD
MPVLAMKSAAIPLAGWGIALVAIAIFGAAQYDLGPLPTLLLAGAGAAAIAAGAAAGIVERRRTRAREPELLVRSSAATLVLTFGATLAFVGFAFVGPGVLWPGVALVIAGAGGLLREHRAARRLAGRDR